MYNDIKSIQNPSAANRFTNFKLHYMKTLLKISLAFIIFISYNNLFASGWQQKLDLINSSDRANNSEIEMMPNGNCIIASSFAQPWDSSIYLHQYKKEDGELLLFNINHIPIKNAQKIHAIKYISSIQQYILIYEEYIPNGISGMYYQIIESFEPFTISPKHLLYAFTNTDLYSQKLVVSETDSSIEAGFTMIYFDNVNNRASDTVSFHKISIAFSNTDTVAQSAVVIIPQQYNSASIQYAQYTMRKVQNDYILNLSNLDTLNRYVAKLITIHDDLSWDSAAVYYPDGFISPQLLSNGNLLVKNNFRGTQNGNDGFTTTDGI